MKVHVWDIKDIIAIHSHIDLKDLKGPIPSYFSISFYTVNQMPMSPRTNFPCECLLEVIFSVKPQCLHVLLGKIRQCIYVLCNPCSITRWCYHSIQIS